MENMTLIEGELSKEYWNNTIEAYLIAGVAIILGLLLIRIFKRLILKRVEKWVAKSETQVDDMIVSGVERFGLPLISFMVVYWGISTLTLSPQVQKVVNVATSVVTAYFVIRFILTTIKIILSSYISKQENGAEKVKQVGGLMIIVNIVIWVLGGIFLFDNLGYNVSTLLTGVGIGGIAIALAAQNIVGDLFNYFVIFFDKPFEVGDSILVDDKNGTIEYIGLKTTRLRSVSGEQIVISNSDLTKSRVHNYKRQETRRIKFNVSISFHTPLEQVRAIPEKLKSIIEGVPDTRFDRAHFANFSDYALVFEVIYFVTVPDYAKYMDVQQEINLKVMELFKQEKIKFLIREDKPGEWDNT
ncbi:MAG: mechanosensitive ion channel family protein [Cyclobacteriaceae bacterium]|nr:mechanosensitive ion channel family protein [Cyclobacteriaceae bacterium]